MSKIWSKSYISLYYILEYSLYTTALHQTIDLDMKTDEEIYDKLHQIRTFDIFQKNIEELLQMDFYDVILNMDAINYHDWNIYVANNRDVITIIRSWIYNRHQLEL